MNSLRRSTLAIEGSCPVSKWLQTALLLGSSEMRNLLNEIAPFFMLRIDAVLSKKEGIIEHSEFLHAYDAYIQSIASGQEVDERLAKRFFQAAWTISLDCATSIEVPNDRHIIKLSRPAVIIQHHRLSFSAIDEKFRSMVFGVDTFPFGIQISYPQLFKDPKTQELEKILVLEKFVNTPLFRKIQKWVRSSTRPVTFLFGDKKTTIPVRIGKEALDFVNHHPWLVKHHFKVA